ncbi:hypothetical protein K438DRAFT_1782044 [Mycena galopus ATCC 62051]|nr:hypothetical protein K438DRAFT_1782044 [Mycena galopus ATCC 62051]
MIMCVVRGKEEEVKREFGLVAVLAAWSFTIRLSFTFQSLSANHTRIAYLSRPRHRGRDLGTRTLSSRITFRIEKERLDAHRYPVLKPPNEITTEIFIRFLPIHQYLALVGTDSPTLPTHICRPWNQIAVDTPWLRRTISFAANKLGCHHLCTVNPIPFLLTRSPSDLVTVAGWTYYRSLRRFFLTKSWPVHCESGIVVRTLDMELHHAIKLPRLESLTLFVDLEASRTGHPDNLLHLPALLRALRLESSLRPEPPDQLSMSALSFGKNQQLRIPTAKAESIHLFAFELEQGFDEGQNVFHCHENVQLVLGLETIYIISQLRTLSKLVSSTNRDRRIQSAKTTEQEIELNRSSGLVDHSLQVAIRPIVGLKLNSLAKGKVDRPAITRGESAPERTTEFKLNTPVVKPVPAARHCDDDRKEKNRKSGIKFLYSPRRTNRRKADELSDITGSLNGGTDIARYGGGGVGSKIYGQENFWEGKQENSTDNVNQLSDFSGFSRRYDQEREREKTSRSHSSSVLHASGSA